MKGWIVFGAIVLVLVCASVFYSVTKPGEPVQAARAEVGSVREYVDERGKTRLPETHLVTMPYPGRIQAITLKENDVVQADAVVAQVHPRDLEIGMDEATAVVRRFEASIKENESNAVENTARDQALEFVQSMVHTVAAAKARMTAGEKRMNYAEDFLADVRKLYDTSVKTQDDVDRADVAHVEAQVNYQQDVLIWQAMQSIQAATALVPKMIDQYVGRKGLTRGVLKQQRAEAQARLQQMELKQRRGSIKSPVTGTVLARRVRNERHLPAGEILLEIGQLERLEVEVDVLSQDVVRIRPGDDVEIYGPAIGAEIGSGVRGRVAQVYPAGFTKVSSLGVEQQRVKVIVSFDDGVLDQLRRQRDLGVDYRVRVRIYTDSKSDALIIPRSALFRGADGGWQVFVVRDGKARLRPVEVGLMNDEHAEVTAGVETDEIVVLAPESSLTDGLKVAPILRD